MRVLFSKHAEFQMKHRDISKKLVRDVVRKPDKSIHRTDATLIAQREVEWHNRSVLCRVIYRREGRGAITVITTYVTTKITKYNE